MTSLLDDSVALISRGRRSIADIIPDVVVDDHSEDRLAITAHAVEKGATVSDHAFLLPKVVEMRLGFSDSSGGYSGYSTEAMNALLALQAERKPFTVSSGKRLFRNMLFAGISHTDDAKTKHSVLLSVRLQEVRLVSVKTTSGTSTGDQAMPEKTAGTVDAGRVQLGTDNWTPTGPNTSNLSIPPITPGIQNWTLSGPAISGLGGTGAGG